jgi:hypothetical protein
MIVWEHSKEDQCGGKRRPPTLGEANDPRHSKDTDIWTRLQTTTSRLDFGAYLKSVIEAVLYSGVLGQRFMPYALCLCRLGRHKA